MVLLLHLMAAGAETAGDAIGLKHGRWLTHNWQLMPDVSWEPSWDWQMVHQHVASLSGWASQCGSWILRGSIPRGRKCKLPGLLKSRSGIGTGYFHCILLVKQSQCHLRFKDGTNTSLWTRDKESNNPP